MPTGPRGGHRRPDRCLLGRGARVIALERHAGRAAGLRSRFAAAVAEGRLVVVLADIRQLHLPARPFRVVANPPFHLARPLVGRLLGAGLLQGADLVLRRDTARNLAAQRTHRRLATEVGRTVPRDAFVPAPSVDAAVLRIRRRPTGRRAVRAG